MIQKIFLASCVIGSIVFSWGISLVQAETFIPETLITEDTVWSTSGSPYIVQGEITVADGATLTIKAGVEVQGVTSDEYTPGISIDNSRLIIQGSADKPVRITQVGTISAWNGSADVTFADMQAGEGFSFTGSEAHIASSTIQGTSQAIRSKDSLVTITDSKIQNNTRAIRVEPHQIFQVRLQSNGFGVGGMGNALDPIPLASSSVTVRNSIITDNLRTAVENFGEYSVEAEGNWWGTEVGPTRFGVNRLMGEVEYEPWLMSEPDLTPQATAACCSSVLFIPGLEATRLYDKTEQLWEPHNNGDVEQLFLNPYGSSTDPTVYAGLPIERAYGMMSIYKSFLGMLSSLKNENQISDWSVFGYDWRKSVPEVVAGQNIHRTSLNGIEQATSTKTLVETVEELATHSKTGKVSIVAHSNGGLITKYLVKTLADMGKDSLIDSVVSVAVPYLGTPQAVSSLLHGDGMELAYGLLLNSTVARQLGQNMSSAYSLLPSATYFSNIFSPTIAFASTTVSGLNEGVYPKEITTAENQRAFILDAFKGNGLLMNAADIFHSIVDPFAWPETIARYAIVGWNKLTTKRVEYENKTVCERETVGMVCKKGVGHTNITTSLGDGTVVVPSASYNAGDTIAIDLKKEAVETGKNVSHADLLESSSTQAVIKSILSGNSQPMLPDTATLGLPAGADSTHLVISTHSPVELHVYDSKGNHTGITDVSLPGVEKGLFTMYESKIPGSDFKMTGDASDPESYVHVPDSASEKYSIIVKGIDVGSALLQVERVNEQGTVESIEYVMPVTPLSTASTTVVLNNSQTQKPLASSTSSVALDVNGDGTSDATIAKGAQFDPILNLEALRKLVSSLLGDAKIADKLDKRIVRVEDLIRKGKLPKAKVVSTKIVKRVGHLNPKKLSQADKDYVVSLIESTIAQFE